MNIKENQLDFLQILNDNLLQARAYMSKIANKPANANLKILGREMAKFIAYKSLQVNPSMVDNVTDLTVNQFIQATNNLTDFRTFKNVAALEPLMSNLPLLRAVFGIYYTTRIEQLKDKTSLFAFDGEEKKPSLLRRFFGSKTVQGIAQNAQSRGQDYAAEKGTNAIDNFISWVGKETGIGQAQGNAANSGPRTYFVWKYFPNNPLNSASSPLLESTSKNWFENTWKPLIENESGLAYDTVQKGFLNYFSKIKAGYFKDQQAFYEQLKKDIAAYNNSQLKAKTTSFVAPIRRGLLSRLLGR